MFFHNYPYTDAHELNLDWVICEIKKLGVDVHQMEEELHQYEGNTSAQIQYLMDWVNNYDDQFAIATIQKYLATMIFVEISDAGYIVYYIPDTWDEITFNTTGLDITVPDVDYGHLVLSY